VVPTQLVAVIGGRGTFGARIVRALVRHRELEVLVVGRGRAGVTAPVSDRHAAGVRILSADVGIPAEVERLLATRPCVVVDTAGPFQERDYALAAACAERGIHFVDIADGPQYVAGIRVLDSLARAHGALLVSGASTVPAVSTALAADLAPDPAAVVAIEVGISPAQRSPRGIATVRSVLRTCGKPVAGSDGATRAIGWSDLQGHRYPRPVGRRLLSNVDTPERLLWPPRFPALERLSVQAGWELAPLHVGLTALSWLVRLHLLRDLESWAEPLRRIAAACDRFGSDAGAMHVSVSLRCSTRAVRQRTGTLLAVSGDGPQIPATPAALVVKKLLALPGYEPLRTRGAQPCLDLFTLDELMRELGGYAISYATESSTADPQPASRKNAIC
jgi:hypothetical protein